MSMQSGIEAKWFVTGAGGSVGSRLVDLLESKVEAHVACLIRRDNARSIQRANAATRWIVGDLLNPEPYASCLSSATTVVHLASAMGKASPAEFQRVNVEGLRRLLRVAQQAGVRRFVFVSSVAAKFALGRYAYYARSKCDGEAVVRGSSVPYAIVRPAIVAAATSGSWQGLARLARLPVTPLFGGGRAMVQPIHVDDLAASILQICEHPDCNGATVEIGGPEKLSLRELLGRMAGFLRGRTPPMISIPMRPIVASLGAVEGIARRWLPFTAGQLATFGNDGTCEINECLDCCPRPVIGVDQMISRTLAV